MIEKIKASKSEKIIFIFVVILGLFSITSFVLLNFFAFHFSSMIMQVIRNFFMKFLIKRKSFIGSYLGTVYKR